MKRLLFPLCILGLCFFLVEKPESKKVLETKSIEKKASCEIDPALIQKAIKDQPGQTTDSQVWTDNEQILRKKWSIQPYHQVSYQEFQSPLGATRVYQFSQRGVPILGMTIRLSRDVQGRVNEEENTYRAIPEIVFDSAELESQALEIKERPVNGGRYEPSPFETGSAVIFVRKNLSEGQLAFSLSAKDHVNGEPVQLLVRSEDGKVLQRSFGRKEFHF